MKQGKFFTGNDIETEGLYVMENGIEMEWVSNLMLVGEDGALDCDCLGLFTGNYEYAGVSSAMMNLLSWFIIFAKRTNKLLFDDFKKYRF